MEKRVPEHLKITQLYELLEKEGGTFTEFGGYYMPVHFKDGIVKEHQAVRENVGFFDISHMGELLITGKEAGHFVNFIGTNNVDKMGPNEIQYQIVCNNDGGVIDDMLAYKFDDENIWLICNASNKEILLKHLQLTLSKTVFDAKIVDESDNYAAVAVQGPNSQAVLEKVLDETLKDIPYMSFKKVNGFIVSNSGYTGEAGYEVYANGKLIVDLAEKLLENEVAACGLGSRDTLRFEAGLPLFGHELSNYISPVQAGLNFAIDFNKKTFIGKEALQNQRINGVESRIVGLELIDRGVARQGYLVYDGEAYIGYITSGFIIPGTKNSYANALIDSKYKLKDEVEIEIRNKRVKARLRKKRYL